MDRYLADSVIIIDYLNDVLPARSWLLTHRRAVVLSAVTVAEVLSDPTADAARIDRYRLLLQTFKMLGINRSTAARAASLRRTERLRLPDAFQAAVALEYGLILATRNTKDFSPARHPFVTVPYTLTPAPLPPATPAGP